MILLDHPPTLGRSRRLALFGTGMLGSAVARALRATGWCGVAQMPVAWGGASEAGDLEAIATRLAEAERAEPGADLHVVWSAGRAGFSATEADADRELRSFSSVLEVAERLARSSERGLTFHLVSSAGGLFEGQRRVDACSHPSPRRPYGCLKLRQEDLLQATPSRIRKRIWRVSSVYGYVRAGHRPGVVSTMIANGLRQAVTPITGRLETLRDFVFADDVGRFVASEAVAEGHEERVVGLLCLGRPSSLFEVQRLAERVVGRRLFVSYSLDPGNSEDITFSPRLPPAGWQPSELRTGMARVVGDLVSHGFSSTPEAAG